MKKIIVTPKGQVGIFEKESSNGKFHYWTIKPDSSINRNSINNKDYCEVTLNCVIPKHLLQELE